MKDNLDQTMYFNKNTPQQDLSPRDTLRVVYGALEAKGYQPLNQLVGYIQSGDPAYITSYNNARSLIKRYDRDCYIEEMLKVYLGGK